MKNCKIYGMAAPSSLNAFIYMYCCYGCEISRCDIAHCASYGSSTYGLASPHCSGLLIVDNYFHDLPNVWPILATSGSAFAYNYFTNEPYQSPTFLSQIVFFHGSHCHYNLFEGNWVATHFNDATAKRELFALPQQPVRPAADARVGPGGTQERPIATASPYRTITTTSWSPGVSWATSAPRRNTTATDTVGESQYNLQRRLRVQCDAASAGQLQHGQQRHPRRRGDGVGGGTVAASYLYTAKPSWFYDRPWPWVDPGNYAQSNDPQNLPAGYRAINGRDPGGLPAAPTNLRIV